MRIIFFLFLFLIVLVLLFLFLLFLLHQLFLLLLTVSYYSVLSVPLFRLLLPFLLLLLAPLSTNTLWFFLELPHPSESVDRKKHNHVVSFSEVQVRDGMVRFSDYGVAAVKCIGYSGDDGNMFMVAQQTSARWPS